MVEFNGGSKICQMGASTPKAAALMANSPTPPKKHQNKKQMAHRGSYVPDCNSMPLVRLGLTMCVVKCSYFLVRHRVSKITLLFCLGGSRQSLKVCKVKCVPRDPATMCPVLFKGSRSLLLLA